MKRQELYNPKQDRGSGNIGATNVGEYNARLSLLNHPLMTIRHAIWVFLSPVVVNAFLNCFYNIAFQIQSGCFQGFHRFMK